MRSTVIRSVLVVLLAFCALTIPTQSSPEVRVAVSVAIAPPDLPVYDQPACPGDGYIWTPGYWAWDPNVADYYWVPGTWVLAPEPGFFWTPGYWAWGASGFVFTAGYWGPVVGFYGGINYGFGYFGNGYVGGRWDHGHFFYNTAVNNVNVTIVHNTYRTTVVNNEVTRVSYNGGNGGIPARPTPEQEAAARERHIGPVAAQTQQINDARNNRDLRASVNHGKPDIAATPRPGDFNGHDIVAAREAGTVHANNTAESSRRENNAVDASRGGGTVSPEDRPASNANAPRPVIHPNDIPPAEKPPAPNTGNLKLDQKYRQQQEKLAAKQTKENEKLQRQQDQEHQRANQQHANEARQQQMEQHHQQQTEQLEQRHQQENQRLQQRQQPAHAPAARDEKKP
jgi:hypothetical protein